MVRGVAQSGSAPVLGTGGREFESRRPDHISTDCCCLTVGRPAGNVVGHAQE